MLEVPRVHLSDGGAHDHDHMYSDGCPEVGPNGGPEISPNGGLKRVHLDTPLQKGASEGTHGDTHLRVIHVYMV